MAASYVSGAAYFSRGFDVVMVKEDLLSQNETRQLSALEQVIAYMTIGRDMSGLFNEVAALTSSANLSIKRLVYLYLQQNSRAQPEKAVLQAGTFVKDSLHDSPLIRAAALRTMANLQISVMSDFLTAPIRRCLEDSDPYVRRAAALALVKQFITAPSITFEFGLIDVLRDLLQDSNALVCGTAVMALLELHSRGATGDVFESIRKAMDHLVSKLPEGNEWAAHYLLEGVAIAYFSFNDATVTGEEFVRNGERVMMKVLPFLSSQNAATATSANKVASLFLRRVGSYPGLGESRKTAVEQRIAPHITQALLSQLEAPRYELRYVALRNTQVFAQSRRMVPFLTEHLGAFLVKHDDPIFVKLEKLGLLVTLANESNGPTVLSELVVYTRDGDAELVAKSIRAIGALATQSPALASQCVQQLEALVNTHVPHIVEDAAVVVQTVLRYYPGKFLGTIAVLCDALTICNDEDARAAVVWVIGEYPERVPDALEYIEAFLSGFMDQPKRVQLAVLAALAKLYVRAPPGKAAAPLAALEKALGMCYQCLTPDLRDRALFYWRLLALDITTARRVLSADVQRVPPHLALSTADRRNQDAFLVGLGAVESVAHKPIRALLGDAAVGGFCRGHHGDDESDVDDDSAGEAASPVRSDGAPSSPTTSATPAAAGAAAAAVGSGEEEFVTVLSAEEAGGVEVAMHWSQLGARLVLTCRLALRQGGDYVSQARVVGLQINRNLHGLGAQQVFPTTTLESGEKPVTVGLIIACNNVLHPTRDVQVAMEIEPVGVRYFLAPSVPAAFVLLPATGCSTADFVRWWKELPVPAWCMPPQMADVCCQPHRLTPNALRVHCLNLVHKSEASDGKRVGLLLFAETIGRHRLLIEVIVEGGVVALLTVRCRNAPIAAFCGEYVQDCITSIS